MRNAIMAVLAGGMLAACSNDNPQGSISIGVTDAPVDNADAVVVTFTAVELLSEDGTVRESLTLDAPQSIDLLALQGSNSVFLVEGATVAPGEYDEVRLLVDAPDPSCQALSAPFASYITIDGTDYPLVVPSGASSGLKVKGPITVAAGGSAAYVVDFDLRKSIAERGNTGCYNLRPVLRITDVAEVGTLSGTVSGALLAEAHCTADPVTGEGAAVYVYDGADATPADVDGIEPDPLTSARLTPKDDGSGDFSYEVGFLLAGSYTASFTCQAGDDDPEASDELVFGPTANVEITAGEVTTQDFAPVATAN